MLTESRESAPKRSPSLSKCRKNTNGRKRPRKTWLQFTRVWVRRMKLLPGLKRPLKAVAGCCRESDGNHLSIHFAATPATKILCAGWDFSIEPRRNATSSLKNRNVVMVPLQACEKVNGCPGVP